jgi:hypothetical protein
MNALVEQIHDSNSDWWSGAITYQWQQSADGLTRLGKFNRNRCNNSNLYTISAVPGTTYYRVLVNAANNGCDQAVSNNAVAVSQLTWW